MNVYPESERELIQRVAKKYETEGYRVLVEPKPGNYPFDLGKYRPDLVATKAYDEGLIIEVKSRARVASIDHLRDIAEIVNSRPGWHFLLITGDEISALEEPGSPESMLPTWEEIVDRKSAADALIESKQYEAAFLSLWSILEALLRKRAEQESIPVERLATSSLIKHIYSQGEISVQQFDSIKALLDSRNQLVHGFRSKTVRSGVRALQELVSQLLGDWLPKQ